MSLRKHSMLSALLSVVFTAMLSFVMLPTLSTAAVFAEDETYLVNYVTYEGDTWVTINPNPRTVAWDEAGLPYKGEGSGSDYESVEDMYASADMEFKGWYADPAFQTKVTDGMKYSDIVGGDTSIKQITLYARIGHTRQNDQDEWVPYHGGDYAPWGYSNKLPGPTDVLPEGTIGWYLLNDVILDDYTSSDEAAWTVPKGTTRLCLNEHNIKCAKKQDAQGKDIDCAVISIPENAELILTDHSTKGTISGGKAGSNSNGYGGGIIVRGKLNMQQGIISDNEAENGGGVAVLGNGDCGLYFCDIKNNSASEYGGGVYVDSTATLHLGSDNISTPKVRDNTVGDKASDVSIAGSGNWNPIEVGGLSDKSVIGIETRTMPEKSDDGEIVITKEIGEAVDVSRMTSNDARLSLTRKQVDGTDKAVLGYITSTVTFKTGEETYKTVQVYGGDKVAEPEPPTREGDAFIEWLLNDKHYDFDSPVFKDLTLVARFKSTHYHDDKTFTAWTSEDSLPTQAGYYYLVNDVTLLSTYELKTRADVHICLNGHTVTRSGDGHLISVKGEYGTGVRPSLTIYDCSEDKTGKLTGARSEEGAICVTEGSFTLNGGNISGNEATGIYADYRGSAFMNGGSISNNTPYTDDTGEVFEIGGVCVDMWSNFKMNGGSISNNEGPGIIVLDNVVELVSGTITGNTVIPDKDGKVSYEGAGIWVAYDAVIQMSGTGKLNITGNKCAGEEVNVYFDNNDDVYGWITFIDGCKTDEGSRIGISTGKKPEEGKPVEFTEHFENHAALTNFISDSGEYQIRKNDSGEAELYFDPIDINVSFDPNGGSGSMADATVKCGQEYALPDCEFVPQDGYEFDKWLIGSKEYEENATVKLKADTVVKAKWKPIVYSIKYDLAGGTMEEGASNPEEYTIESEAITLTQPVRDSYEFVGWTGTDLDEPSKEVTIPTGTIGDKEYTATWTPVTYSITYMLNGGKLPAGKKNPYSYTVESDSITLINPVLEGSKFRGWYLKGSDADETTEMVIEKGSSGDKVFMALWGGLDHVHVVDSTVAAKAATCEDDGNIAYYVCSCGVAFLNKDGTGEADLTKSVDKGGVIIPAKGHKWNAGKVTKAATKTTAGVKTYTCTVCGATKTEAIPKKSSGGQSVAANSVLLSKLKAKGNRSLVLTWNKVDGVDGYDVFFIKCSKKAPKKVKTIKGNQTFKWTKKGLKKKTAYKARVKAFVMKNGKKTYVKSSPIVHAYTSGGTKKFTNAKRVIVKKTSVSLKAGKTHKIKAKASKLQMGKKLMPKGHVAQIRYISDNKKIATVSKKGKITAKSKGSCKVYVIASDGVYKEVKVTVK